jgi:excisionase family DNA binding protein
MSQIGVKSALCDYPEVQRELHLSRPSVRRLVDSGHIRVVRFGRSVRLRRDDIDALIEAGGVRSDRQSS